MGPSPDHDVSHRRTRRDRDAEAPLRDIPVRWIRARHSARPVDAFRVLSQFLHTRPGVIMAAHSRAAGVDLFFVLSGS
jgi:hypothetical protein